LEPWPINWYVKLPKKTCTCQEHQGITINVEEGKETDDAVCQRNMNGISAKSDMEVEL
jgi:hypothetical protein